MLCNDFTNLVAHLYTFSNKSNLKFLNILNFCLQYLLFCDMIAKREFYVHCNMYLYILLKVLAVIILGMQDVGAASVTFRQKR